MYQYIFTCHFFLHETVTPTAYFVGRTSPLSVDVDERVRLECHATGWPLPSITWMRNGRNVLDINQNHQYQVSPSEAGHGSILVIIATQRQDEGKYICMAKNALDEYNRTFVVEVKGNSVFC